MEFVKEREIKGIYQSHDAQKFQGAHYTPNNLAHFTASRILEQNKNKLKNSYKIFDPAIGDGELLYALAELLLARGVQELEIHGFDIDTQALDAAKKKLKLFGNKVQLKILEKDFLEAASAATLFKKDAHNHTYDFIIANPPYVRTQSLGVKNSTKLSEEFSLDGRVDLYYAFLLGISHFMNENTVAGFIVSNRFMTTKSGGTVRKGLSNLYSINEVWDLGDTKLFDAAVLPALLVFSKKQDTALNTKFVSIYTSKNPKEESQIQSVFEAVLSGDGFYRLGNEYHFEVKAGTLQHGSEDVWRISNEKTNSWLNQVEKHTAKTFGDIGKIRVGVKTTADKVFINKHWDQIEKDQLPEAEVLKPLITHHFAGRFKQLEGNNRKILYPHISVHGKKQNIDLNQFPKAKKYLAGHKEQLERREYVIQAGRQWFEIWVPHEPEMWKHPKIVFRDISDRPTFWIDFTGSIVNGDCYWISLFDGVSEDNLWVALAVANSTFIESFYDHRFNNKLYAGRRRFMTQYVEQFPLPKLTLEQTQKIVSLTKEIFSTLPTPCEDQEKKLDHLVWESFGFTC